MARSAAGGVADDPPLDGAEVSSSTSVFQAPQPGQRPTHFGDAVPQSLQQNRLLIFATPTTLPRGCDAISGPVRRS